MSEGEFKKRIHERTVEVAVQQHYRQWLPDKDCRGIRQYVYDSLDEARTDILEAPFGNDPWKIPYLLNDGTIIINTLYAEEKLVTICKRLLKWFGDKK